MLLSRCRPLAAAAARPRAAVRRFGGGHGHGPAPPSFARLPPPSGPVHEEADLLWNDSVAPELALDFDAPEISREKGLAMWYAVFSVGKSPISATLPSRGRAETNSPLSHDSGLVALAFLLLCIFISSLCGIQSHSGQRLSAFLMLEMPWEGMIRNLQRRRSKCTPNNQSILDI